MPTELGILGFSNSWYKAGMANSAIYPLPSGLKIRVLTLPFFLATKIEAFLARGHGDYMGSKDMEDIVTIIDGCADCFTTLNEAPSDVRNFLVCHLKALLLKEQFLNSVAGHLPPDPSNSKRAKRLLAQMNEFVSA
jgi:hypothetical protein